MSTDGLKNLTPAQLSEEFIKRQTQHSEALVVYADLHSKVPQLFQAQRWEDLEKVLIQAFRLQLLLAELGSAQREIAYVLSLPQA